MSGDRLGVDCCGDMYECNTSVKCPCGCGVFYCGSCFEAHCVDIVMAGARTRGRPKGAEEVRKSECRSRRPAKKKAK